MFAILVPGQVVRADFQQVSETQCFHDLPCMKNTNHIAVFMTGQTPLPEGYGAAVHLGLNSTEGEAWYYLGFLSNMNPTAFYRIGRLKDSAATSNGAINPFMGNTFLDQNNQVVHAKLGISVEPIANLQSIEPASGSQIDENLREDAVTSFIQYAAQNLFDYVASFAHDNSINNDPLVPISSIKRWFDKIHSKLAIDPFFWRS